MNVSSDPLPSTPLPPTTTLQQDLIHEGQRRINLIWEYTQAMIAMVVVISTMISGAYLTMQKDHGDLPTVLSMAFGTVVGFYFSRTNHAAIGGVGAKADNTEYRGR